MVDEVQRADLHDRPPPPTSTPSVIGEDGVSYGFYEMLALASVPVTPAGGEAEWGGEVAVSQDATGLYLYILLSAGSGKQRLYANYAIDITDK